MSREATPKLELEHPGVLHTGGQRHLLVQPMLLSEVQKGVEDRLGAKAAEFLYAAGSTWAEAMLRRLKAALAAEGEELALLFCSHASEMGWGRWQLESYASQDNRITVRVQHSPTAAAYGQSDEPVCHLLAGAINGLAEFLLGLPCACNELSCLAQGGPDCLFMAEGQEISSGEGWEW